MRFTYVAQAGGVQAAVTSDFDEDAVLDRELERIGKKIAQELAAYITVGSKFRDGDYAKRRVILEIP